ncbi:hypothetical protein [Roseisolibacter agri]|uniref:Uncharacterized protein n=1 Tax=Roseisolibacter agri TaxID=2014610 RepID=A0AA37V952_9BACT|nr:hypothetical protein [Roseisolibacter agri]GLC28511.1 hypothetical protein rosag_50240 [Roseisolibacter agri]
MHTEHATMNATTTLQPPPPAPPTAPGVPGAPAPTTVQAPSEAAVRVTEELDRARQAVAEIAPAQEGARPEMGVTTTPDGRIRIVARDGQVTVLDRNLFRPDQIEELVQTALEPPPPPEIPDRGPPEGVIALMGILAFFVTLMVIGFPLARALSRRMDRKTQGGGVPADVGLRLERIEQAVEAVAVEVERVSEAQRFSARLLSERLPEVLPRLDAAAESMQRRRIEG